MTYPINLDIMIQVAKDSITVDVNTIKLNHSTVNLKSWIKRDESILY